MEQAIESHQPQNGAPVVPTAMPEPVKDAQIATIDLAPEELALLREIQAQIDALNNQGAGACRMILKQRKLEGGPWEMDLVSGKLVKKAAV